MTSRKELLSLFDELEKERLELLTSLSNRPKEVLVKKPSADSWSVTEVVLHLAKAEEGALKYMRVKLEHGGHKKASFGAAVKQKLLNLAIALPFKYKAPSVIELDATGNTSFAEAQELWGQIRSNLKKEYESIDESIIDHELFKHPAAGKLSIMQSVRFMRQHVQRHVGQIERVLKAVD
ncbi:MAG: DinB family protein [Flavobacteriales bacterium]